MRCTKLALSLRIRIKQNDSQSATVRTNKNRQDIRTLSVEAHNSNNTPDSIRQASNADVVLTISITAALLASSVVIFGSDSSAGANQIALVIGAVIATIVGIKNGHSCYG